MYFWPKVVISATQVSMTALISGWLIRGRVTLDLGLKHITLHVPRAAADLRELFFTFATRFRINITLEKKKQTHLKRGSPVSSGSGTSSSSAGKSLLKTNVVSYLNNPLSWCCQTHVSSVYFGLVSPLGRVTPGQRGFVGSNSGLSSSVTFSTW